MYVTKFTYYSLRALIYLANNRDHLCTVNELAENLKVSHHHLKKIIHKLAKTDFIITTQGRLGGVKLGLAPRDIKLSDVIKITESNLNIENYYEDINSSSKLKEVMQVAVDGFVNEFSKFTLANLL